MVTPNASIRMQVEDAPLGAPPAAPATSRFNMDTLEEKKPAMQVGGLNLDEGSGALFGCPL